MPQPLERTIVIKTTTVLKVIGIILALVFAWLIRDIIALLFVALFLAALMHPAVRWGARRGIPKGVTVILIYLALFALTGLVLALLIPTLIAQIGALYQRIGVPIPDMLNQLRHFTVDLVTKGRLPSDVASFVDQFSSTAQSLLDTLGSFFGGLAGLAIILVLAFYMEVEERAAVRLFRDITPGRYQDKAAGLLLQVEDKMGSWLSGQMFLSLIVGILYYIGLLTLGIDGALVLAAFGAFTEFIPYLGPILGGIPIVIVAFTQSPLKAVLALGLVFLIQQMENHFIVPKVMQKAVGLNPLVSIVSVLVGAKLFGVVGALLAIPVATALSVILSEFLKLHHENK